MKHIKPILLIVLFLASCVPTIQPPTPTQTPTLTLTPTQTATQTPSPTPTITPTPTQIGGGSGKFIFEYYKIAYEKSFPDLKGDVNIFTSNLNGTNLKPVTNGLKGINDIESISNDGQMALVSSRTNYPEKGDLYLIHLNLPDSPPIKLASGLVRFNLPQAIFLDDTRIVYIGQGIESYGFYIVNIDGTNPKKISTPAAKPFGIVSADKTHVYWDSFVKKTFTDSYGFKYAWGDFDSLWWTNIDGSGQGELESNGNQIITYSWHTYAFSLDGKSVAWNPGQKEPECSFGGFDTRSIRDGTYTKWAAEPNGPFSPAARSGRGQVIDMPWVESYVRRCFILYVASLSDMDHPTRIVLMPPANLLTKDFQFGSYYKNLVWSPDGSKLLLFADGVNVTYFQQEPILYYTDLTDPQPVLTQWRSHLFSSDLAEKIEILDLSPDGRQIMVAVDSQGPYINILNLEPMNFVDDFGSKITPDSQIRRVGNIYWLP